MFALVFLVLCLAVDTFHIYQSKQDYEPLITRGVVMTILGASTVQLGSLALMLGKYLFPTRPNKQD